MRSAIRARVLTVAAVVLLASSGVARAEISWIDHTWNAARGAAAQTQTAVDALEAWVRRSYQRRPAVIVGLAAVVALPVLALAGWFLYRRRPAKAEQPVAPDLPTTAAAALVEVDGAGRFELPGGRNLLQIGRHDDNDVCLLDASVHRYHAVIERSARTGFIITDLSGPEGSGLRVNGERLASKRLSHGDTLELGNARMRFEIAA